MTAPATVPAAPDRAIPQELIDLAVLAIKRGAQSVSLINEGLGAEFSAPIGWLLWIREADENGIPKQRAHLVTHQIGSDISELALPAEFASNNVAEVPVVDELIELFQTAVKNGWGGEYERMVLEHGTILRMTEKYGIAEKFGMRHQLRCTAPNWGYDKAAHDRGDQVSVEASLGLRLTNEGGMADPVAFTDHDGAFHETERQVVDELLKKPAPNTVPVAYFDEELGDWVK